jgi:hypothetical protein
MEIDALIAKMTISRLVVVQFCFFLGGGYKIYVKLENLHQL